MPWYFISVNNSIADIAADPDIYGNTGCQVFKRGGALCVEMGFTWTFPGNQDATW